jgi:hypothetical protein
MDEFEPTNKPSIKQIHSHLTLTQIKQIEKLVEQLQSLSSNKKVFRRPRGRPRKNPTYEAFPIARPSSIPKRKKLRLTQRELLKSTVLTKFNPSG